MCAGGAFAWRASLSVGGIIVTSPQFAEADGARLTPTDLHRMTEAHFTPAGIPGLVNDSLTNANYRYGQSPESEQ